MLTYPPPKKKPLGNFILTHVFICLVALCARWACLVKYLVTY